MPVLIVRSMFIASTMLTCCLAPSKLIADDYIYGVSISIPFEKQMQPELRPFVSKQVDHFSDRQSNVNLLIDSKQFLRNEWSSNMDADQKDSSENLKKLINWYGLGIAAINLGVIYFVIR